MWLYSFTAQIRMAKTMSVSSQSFVFGTRNSCIMLLNHSIFISRRRFLRMSRQFTLNGRLLVSRCDLISNRFLLHKSFQKLELRRPNNNCLLYTSDAADEL